MTVRIGDAAQAERRRERPGDTNPGAPGDRRRPATGAVRRHRHGWWYHLESALLKSRA